MPLLVTGVGGKDGNIREQLGQLIHAMMNRFVERGTVGGNNKKVFRIEK